MRPGPHHSRARRRSRDIQLAVFCFASPGIYGLGGFRRLRSNSHWPTALDRVLADVVPRNQTVASAVARLRQLNPEARVLFLSGFTLEGLFQGGWVVGAWHAGGRFHVFPPKGLLAGIVDPGSRECAGSRSGDEYGALPE